MNETIFYVLNSISGQSAALDAVFLFFAVYLGWVLIVSLAIFLFSERARGSVSIVIPRAAHVKELSVIFFTAFGAWLIASALQDIFMIDRPFLVLDHVNTLFTKGGADSFPSGHASFFGALAVGLYFYHKKLAYLYGAGAFVIGVSRVVSGVHWPLDILAGYLLGGIIAYSMYVLATRKTR